MKIIHNKLVRDNILEIISASGKEYKSKILDEATYQTSLKAKLVEEAQEVVESKDKLELISEIADVLELIEALKVSNNISDEEILEVKNKKALKNGKFEKRIYLEYVIEQ